MDNIDSESPICSLSNNTSNSDYITVVSVGSNDTLSKFEHSLKQRDGKDYITVLKISGTDEKENVETVTEEVLVYRLPGEKLGFGLKFEGGTKSSEFVKRLFIQSCAVNSPASRVESSWGCLVEGDEVLEIDSVPVNTITRTDCVRCLKDSNVVIKLLIRHRFEDNEDTGTNFSELSSRSVEDLPLVISAEKKRTPPPPPPVPPRKVNRKSKENIASIVIPPNGFADHSCEPNQIKQNHDIPANNLKNHRLQSPYNSFRKQRQSPEVIKRIRRLSDDISCPPDAEVYIDLFSQESAYSLSESDDTGSSISTVVDKIGSYPTTTNSSFAGSLPSTPTPIQRHIYLTENFDLINDNYLFSKLITSEPNDDEDEPPEDLISDKDPLQKVETSSNDNTPLQPPANFQDAPLSYGNEDVTIIKSELKINLDVSSDRTITFSSDPARNKPPSPPPRTRSLHMIDKGKRDQVDEDVVDAPGLPRLVDFVPKSNKSSPVRELSPEQDSIEVVKKFLEKEKYNFDYVTIDDNENHIKNYDLDLSMNTSDNSWSEDSEFYSLDWSPSFKLATIGEDEEEVLQEPESQPMKIENPVVIIENADIPDECYRKYVKNEEDDDKHKEKGVEVTKVTKEVPKQSTIRTTISHPIIRRIDVDEIIMDGPRQPPDGHEFPDLEKPMVEQKMPVIEQQIIEKPPPPIKPRDSWMSKYEPQVNNVRDKIAIFSKPQTTLTKKYVSTSSIPADSSTLGKDKDEFRSSTTSLLRKNSINDSTSSFQTPRYKTSASITPEYKPQDDIDTVTLRRKPDTPAPRLHSRSVSLLDINEHSNSNKLDRWSLLIEQRSLSKLKGLVIPEHEPETDSISKPFVDLPEIQSIVPPVITRTESKTNEIPMISRRHSSSISNLQTPQSQQNPQISQTKSKDTSSTLPKYSPAFKKRSFQIHSSFNTTVPSDGLNLQTKNTNTNSINPPNISVITPGHNADVKIVSSPVKTRDFSHFTVNTSTSSDPPKSLESIASPTRSDYSFDFNHVSQARNLNTELKPLNSKDKIIIARPNSYVSDVIGSSEYESDTDSALSSSQSSYISKNSPPASPIHIRNDSLNDIHKRNLPSPQIDSNVNYESLNRRLLKPQSLEAINRKNILASARCRSGRDLKVGSPLIQRKFEDNDILNTVEMPKTLPNESTNSKSVPEEEEAIVQENIVAEPPKNEILSEPEKVASPRTRVENLNLPKVILSDIKSNVIEKPIEPVKRNFPNSEYYSHNKPVVRRASSVTDLRKNFEKIAPTPAKRNSINSIITSSPTIQPQPIKRTSLPQLTPIVNQETRRNPERSFTTVNNNYDTLIENAIKEFEENISKSDVKVVHLKPDVDGGSLGITLAGGADYETKEITIHKIREGSPAFRDGRLQKGDKILAINGKYMKGFSHAQSLRALKETVPEVIIIACKGSESNSTIISAKISSRPVSFEMSKEVNISDNDNIIEATTTTNMLFEVSIIKDATGLGFSIQGGKSSPQGDVPLIIKKIFMGGAAEKVANLKAGDELLEINHIDVTSMSRMEAWNLMKKLPEQEITIKVRR